MLSYRKLVPLALFVCLVYVATGDESSSESLGSRFEKLENVWEAFKTRFAKRYPSMNEEETRRQVFLRKLAIIKAHNIEESLGMHSFSLALNDFADWSKEEYQKYLTGFRPRQDSSPTDTDPSSSQVDIPHPPVETVPDQQQEVEQKLQVSKPEFDVDEFVPYGAIAAARAARRGRRWRRGLQDVSSLPAEVDWRSKGWVTPVKNQGKCGSCWSFTATGALEGQNFNKTGVLVALSEQNLVDCSTSNYGCNGGVTDYAFRYVKQNGGIASEESYPYTGKQGTCNYRSSNSAGTCSGWVDLPSGDERALQTAVATVGPVAVAIDASSILFQLYRKGVYKNPFCSSTNLDHAVLVVGYGTYKGTPYWLVKNSWGTSWGQDGYVMMARNQGNMCGIATMASYPKY